MSNRPDNIFRPFDSDSQLNFGSCTCGKHQSQSECNASFNQDQIGQVSNLQKSYGEQSTTEQLSHDLVEAVAVKALFPHEPTRRAFLKSVGTGTAMAAIASVLPIASLQEAAALDKLNPEKKQVDIGFLPILCATPLIMADPIDRKSVV